MSASCYQHPDVVATSSCSECLQPICARCASFVSGGDGRRRCQSCNRRYFRGFTIRGYALTAVVLAIILGYKAYRAGLIPSDLLEMRSKPASDFDYGDKALLVEAMREQLEEMPCDRSKVVEYLQTLYAANDLRGSIAYADDIIRRCGKFPQLRSITYSAHTRLNEFDLAIRDATELIESSPGNAGYWVWRGMAREASSASALALADFQQAFRLAPDEFQTTNHLASAYGRAGRMCDSLLVLLVHSQSNPASANRPDVKTWIAGLSVKGTCELGKGRAVVPLARKGATWVEPLVEGKTRGRFILDSRSTMVMLSREFARRLGLKLADGAPTVPLRTAEGLVQVHIARVQSLELQGARADDVEVAIVPSLPEGRDGVLGLGFLARFDMKVDGQAGQIALSERKSLEPSARN